MPHRTRPGPGHNSRQPPTAAPDPQPEPARIRPARITAPRRPVNDRQTLEAHGPSRPSGPAATPREPDEPAASPTAQHCCPSRCASGHGRLLHTAEQAGQLLEVPANWLQRAAADGRIPATYIGKYLRFSNADLEAIINAAHRPADPRQPSTT